MYMNLCVCVSSVEMCVCVCSHHVKSRCLSSCTQVHAEECLRPVAPCRLRHSPTGLPPQSYLRLDTTDDKADVLTLPIA